MNTVCPVCEGQMKPLMTSWFCPKDCDRPKVVNVGAETPFASFKYWDANWRLGRLKDGDMLPSWATRGWWVSIKSPPATQPLAEVAMREGQYLAVTSWSVSQYGANNDIVDGKIEADDPRYVLIILGLDPESSS